jgi:hypothetical protein
MGTKRMDQNQAEVNAHPSQIALGAMLPLEIFVMLMLMVTEFLNDRTNGIQRKRRLWINLQLNYKNLDFAASLLLP